MSSYKDGRIDESGWLYFENKLETYSQVFDCIRLTIQVTRCNYLRLYSVSGIIQNVKTGSKESIAPISFQNEKLLEDFMSAYKKGLTKKFGAVKSIDKVVESAEDSLPFSVDENGNFIFSKRKGNSSQNSCDGGK